MSVQLWNFKDGGQDFWPWINILKGFLFNPSMNYGSSKSAKIVLLKSIFDVKNQLNFFKKKLFKNINLGDHYLVKTFFSRLNFWTTLLSKIIPNFWWTDIPRRNFLNFSLGRYICKIVNSLVSNFCISFVWLTSLSLRAKKIDH
jgi:hypothetical protein